MWLQRISGAMPDVARAEALRQKHFHWFPNHFGAAVTELPLRHRVGIHDPTFLISGQNPLAGVLEQRSRCGLADSQCFAGALQFGYVVVQEVVLGEVG